jgi:aryl-alcohol dehydrogenase-like predicted oxidoreductase
MPSRSNIGFGCVSLTAHKRESAALQILSAAFEEGITHFDTAPVYGQGYSEKILGKFIRQRRSQVTITTKVGLGPVEQKQLPAWMALPLHALKKKIRPIGSVDAPAITDPEPLTYRKLDIDYVSKSLENSLRNCRTDYLDYYLLHEALPAFLTEKALEFLIKQKETGVIRNLGIAASHVNLNQLNVATSTAWSVLQYENGVQYDTDEWVRKIENKTHFYHSTLKFLKKAKTDRYTITDIAGILLNKAARNNPQGKVLFSTTKKKTIQDNLISFEKASSFSTEEMKNIVNAIY